MTDVRPGEPDILARRRFETLRIVGLDRVAMASFPAPEAGWTHEALEVVAEGFAQETIDGADAFLGSHWVGGTEV